MTLNQIISQIRTIALAHEQINSFGFGEIGDFLDSEITYPACFLELPTETITGQLGAGAERRQSFNMYFFDRHVLGGDNRDEVLSDMQLVALDIFYQLRYQKFDFNVLPDSSLDYFIEREADYTAGVRLNFTVKYPLRIDRCAVPSTYNY